jgi:ligand-binding SRPBCC domain-containing protein
MSKVYIHECGQRIEFPLEQVYAFYGDARNLERITPPWLGFEVTTPAPIEMAVGTLIEYRLKLHRVPVRWRTRIEVWEPPRRFVDVQVRGPYSLWEHTHEFEEDGAGATVIRDRVRYSLPFGPLGKLVERWLVRRDLKQIFDYRRDAVTREISDDVGFAPARRSAGSVAAINQGLGPTLWLLQHRKNVPRWVLEPGDLGARAADDALLVLVEVLVAREGDPAQTQLVDGGIDVVDFEVEHRVAGRGHVGAEVHEDVVAIRKLQPRQPVLLVENLDAQP